MAILNYTTQIQSEKTIGEIQKCLVKHGANNVTTSYQNKLPSGITFCLMIQDRTIAFCLPADHRGVLKAMQKDPDVPGRMCNEDQAMRVSWRIIKDWVEAQMAIVEAQLADVAEVFLPYAVTPNGSTLYKEIKSNGMKLLN